MNRKRRPAPPPAAVAMFSPYNRPHGIELVGCGGTGARLAELLCRMAVGFGMPGLTLRLWDGDAVEPANIARQNFEPCELGANKAQALALRLSGRFGVAVSAMPQHLDLAALREIGKVADGYNDRRGREHFAGKLVITCTDNLPSRRLVAQEYASWWLDVGNGLTSGQAVLGCTHADGRLAWLAGNWQNLPEVADGRKNVQILPDLAAVDPSFMRSRGRATVGPSCAAMPFSVQGFGVNELAALAAATLVKAFLVDGRLEAGAIFFDASAGRMTPRPLTPDWYALARKAKR